MLASRHAHLLGALVLASIAGSMSAGCGGGSTRRGPGGEGYASFAWMIYDVEDKQYTTALTCAEVGASHVQITLIDAVSGLEYPQAPVLCNASPQGLASQDWNGMETSTGYVPVGNYYVTYDLLGDPSVYGTGTVYLDRYEDPDLYSIGVGANPFSPIAYLVQAFKFSWNVYYQSIPSTCAAVGATYVDFDFSTAGLPWVTTRFYCDELQGISSSIPLGATSAQWRMFLVSANEATLGGNQGGTVPIRDLQNVYLGTVNLGI